MIYEIPEDGIFVVSSHGVWLPGLYATKQAARYAMQFPDEILAELASKNKVITSKMLRDQRNKMTRDAEVAEERKPVYSRSILKDVVEHHYPALVFGCVCGWSENKSHADHVVDVYETSVLARIEE